MQIEFTPAEFATLAAMGAAHTHGGGSFGLLQEVQWPTSNVAARQQTLLALRELGALIYTGGDRYTIPARVRELLGI